MQHCSIAWERSYLPTNFRISELTALSTDNFQVWLKRLYDLGLLKTVMPMPGRVGCIDIV